MAYRIIDIMQDFTDRTTGARSIMCEIAADTAADLPANTADLVYIIGSFATALDTGGIYKINSAGTWILQPSNNAFDNVYTKTEIDNMLLSYYTKTECDNLFVWKTITITGESPLDFVSDGSTLASWSIYGNMTNDVPPDETGDMTANLWNYTIEQGGWDAESGTIPTKYEPDNPNFTIRCRVADIIPIPSRIMSFTCPRGIKINFVWVDVNGVSLGGSGWQQNGSTVTAPESAVNITFILAKVDDSTCSPSDFQNIMLSAGSIPLPYEPFGYKITVSYDGESTTIYLDEPLRKALDGTDAVDVMRSDGTITREVDSNGDALVTPTTETYTAPTITPTAGENTLTVDTTLPPSEISITGQIREI